MGLGIQSATNTQQVAVQIEEIPPPPCTTKVCGGKYSVGPVDALFVSSEAIMAVAALVFGFTGNYVACGAVIAGMAGNGASYGAYRKWGNLAAIVERYNRIPALLETERQGYVQENQRLHTDIGAIQSTLAEEKQQITLSGQTIASLAKEKEDLQKALAEFKTIVEGLNAANEKLKNEVQGLEATNTEFKSRIHEFLKQNTIFKEDIQKISGLLPKIAAVGKSLDQSVEFLDKTFDEDIDELEQQLAITQKIVREIVEIFQKGKDAFLQEIAHFNQEEEDLNKLLQQYEIQTKAFKALQEVNEKLRDELMELKNGIQPSVQALASERKAIEQGVENLKGEHRALTEVTKTTTGLNEEMRKFQDRLDKTAKAQEQSNAAILLALANLSQEE